MVSPRQLLSLSLALGTREGAQNFYMHSAMRCGPDPTQAVVALVGFPLSPPELRDARDTREGAKDGEKGDFPQARERR